MWREGGTKVSEERGEGGRGCDREAGDVASGGLKCGGLRYEQERGDMLS